MAGRRFAEVAGALLLAISVGLGVVNVLSDVDPTPRCTDGWHSPSIGRLGACSHHGGVNYSGISRFPDWANWVGGGAGTFTFVVCLMVGGQFRRTKVAEHGSSAHLFDDQGRQIKEAILRQERVRFVYTGHDGAKRRRYVRPLELTFIHGARCLRGYCYWRQAERHFILSRMVEFEILDREKILALKETRDRERR